MDYRPIDRKIAFFLLYGMLPISIFVLLLILWTGNAWWSGIDVLWWAASTFMIGRRMNQLYPLREVFKEIFKMGE